MKLLETLSVLPMGDGGRFGSLSLGMDRVDRVREEYLALREIAAWAVCRAAADLSLDDLTEAIATVTARSDDPTLPDGMATALMSLVTDPAPTDALRRDAVLWLLAGNRTAACR